MGSRILVNGGPWEHPIGAASVEFEESLILTLKPRQQVRCIIDAGRNRLLGSVGLKGYLFVLTPMVEVVGKDLGQFPGSASVEPGLKGERFCASPMRKS